MAEKKTAVEAAPVKYVNRLEKKYKEYEVLINN